MSVLLRLSYAKQIPKSISSAKFQLLSKKKVASVTKEWNFKFYFMVLFLLQ